MSKQPLCKNHNSFLLFERWNEADADNRYRDFDPWVNQSPKCCGLKPSSKMVRSIRCFLEHRPTLYAALTHLLQERLASLPRLQTDTGRTNNHKKEALISQMLRMSLIPRILLGNKKNISAGIQLDVGLLLQTSIKRNQSGNTSMSWTRHYFCLCLNCVGTSKSTSLQSKGEP